MSPGLQFSSGAWGLFPSSLVVGSLCDYRIKVPVFLLVMGWGIPSASRACLRFLAMWLHGWFTIWVFAFFQAAWMHFSALLFCVQPAGENPPPKRISFVIAKCNHGSLSIFTDSTQRGHRLHKGVGHLRILPTTLYTHRKKRKYVCVRMFIIVLIVIAKQREAKC